MGEVDNYLRVLSDSLEQKKDVLAKILVITKQQEDLAAAGELDEIAFSNSVNEKEVLIARLNQIDEGFTTIYNRIRQEVIDGGGVYDTEIRNMQNQIKSCVEIGNEIQVTEERNQTKLAIHFQEKNQEYKVKASSNQVAKSYYQSMAGVQYRDPFFIDQKK